MEKSVTNVIVAVENQHKMTPSSAAAKVGMERTRFFFTFSKNSVFCTFSKNSDGVLLVAAVLSKSRKLSLTLSFTRRNGSHSLTESFCLLLAFFLLTPCLTTNLLSPATFLVEPKSFLEKKSTNPVSEPLEVIKDLPSDRSQPVPPSLGLRKSGSDQERRRFDKLGFRFLRKSKSCGEMAAFKGCDDDDEEEEEPVRVLLSESLFQMLLLSLLLSSLLWILFPEEESPPLPLLT